MASGVSIAIGSTQPAQAATIALGQVTAQVSDHLGQDNGTGGNNCIRYSPQDGSNPRTTFNASPTEVRTAHGYNSSCPSTLSTTSQSTVGVVATSLTSVTDGTPFLLGKVTHYNNPVTVDDDFFTGKMTFALAGLTAPNNKFSWDWTIWETSNSQSACPQASWWKGNGNCVDQIKFASAISQETVTIGSVPYRVVVDGFRPATNNSTCPATPSGTPGSDFLTDESAQTVGCVYVTLAQVRSLKIVKKVVSSDGSTVPNTTFNYTTTSSKTGSPWDNKPFALTSSSTTSASKTAELLQTETATVTETQPAGDQWALTSIGCVDGTGAAVPEATTNLTTGKLTLTNVAAPSSAAAAPITCTYTNTYTPKGTLTLVKKVTSGSAVPADFTLRATGPITVSGTGGSAAVNGQRVPIGTYTLTETGPTGYVNEGWVCTGGSAGQTGASGTITVADGQNITCTVSNRFQTGKLRIVKQVTDPANGFTGNATTAFTGSYACGPGVSGTFSVSTGTPFVSGNLPTGVQCTVTETAPSGNLRNSSYSWGAPSYSVNPVTIGDGTTTTVTVTNPINQATGSIRLAKVVSPRSGTPASGWTGGGDRTFPMTYSCTLPGTTVVASGTRNVSVNTPVTVSGVAAGAACTVTENLAGQSGDFVDASYAWDGYTVAPGAVTVAANQTTTATVTNFFKRNFSDLVVKKVVQGGGYVGTGTPFAITVDCGNNPVTLNLAAGGSATTSVPANTQCSVVETAPAGNLLAASYDWGTPSYAGLSNGFVVVATGGTATVTVTNPTVQVWGKVSVTKAISPLSTPVVPGTTFAVTVACDAAAQGGTGNYQQTFQLAVGQVQASPNLPVGTSCTVTEAAPTGSAGLVDGSYVWDGAPAAQSVRVGPKNTTVAVTVTNKVVRAYGSVAITKAVSGLNGVNGAATTFSGTWSCTYGNDPAVNGTWSRTGAGSATLTGPANAILIGSVCSMTEGAPNPSAPHPTDTSYLWGAASFSPTSVTVTTANPNATLTVTNPVRRVTGSLAVGKVVMGGAAGTAYVDQPFSFTVSCLPAGGGSPITGSVSARAGQTTPLPAGLEIPAGSTCTVTEDANPAATDPYRWDAGVGFAVTGASGNPSGRSVTFTTPADGAVVTVIATNTISARTVNVTVAKQVVDPDGGFTGNTRFDVSLTCAGTTYGPQSLAAGGSATISVPLGVTCTASEAPVPTGAGLADASFAWGAPSVAPGSVTAAEGSTPRVTVTNPVERVRGSIGVTKVVDEAGYSGVLAPQRTYSGTWTCVRGSEQSNGTWTVNGAGAATLTGPSNAVPLTANCTVTENAPGPVSGDSSYTWAPVQTTSVTVSRPGPNTLRVTNTIQRNTTSLTVRKTISGEESGYVRTADDFTVSYRCYLSDPQTGPFYEGDVQVAAGAAPIILANDIPQGWTCQVAEVAPANSLLRDASYAWGTPSVRIDGNATSTVTLGAANSAVVVDNPITRVRGTLSLRKAFGPGVQAGVVDPDTVFAGSWSCVYDKDLASEETFSGTWSVTGTGTATLSPSPQMPYGTVCKASEDAPSDSALTDSSWTWLSPTVSTPVTVGAATAPLVVTNDVKRVYADLSVVKVYAGPAAALPPGTTVAGAWSCLYDGTVVGQGRWELPATGGTELLAGLGARLPAESVCTVTEDTLDDADLTDSSYRWITPVLSPTNGVITLSANGGQKVTVTNDVERVRGSFVITKKIAGETGIDTGLTFSGDYSCTYGSDAAVTGSWSVTDEGSHTVNGILLGSVCTATEDTTTRGVPVAGDSSYVWNAPTVTPGSVTVASGDPLVLTVTNTASRLTGSFAITKQVAGTVAGEPADQTYTFDYRCTARNGNVRTGSSDPIQAGELWNSGQIPQGSTCEVTEQALPDIDDPSYAWQAPTFTVSGVGESGGTAISNGISFIVPTSGNGVVVTATNTLDRHTRNLEVAKTLSGATAGYTTGDFSVDVECTPISGATITQTLTINPTTPGTVADIPVGSTCELAEQDARPNLADPSYSWGTPTWSPSATVLVDEGRGPVSVTVDNPISRAFGTFSVTKQVIGTGARDGMLPETEFTVDYTCRVPGAADPVIGQLRMTATATATYPEQLPMGSACELSEPVAELPDTQGGYAWEAVAFTVDGVPIGRGRSTDLTIGSDTTVAVVATNTLTRTPGGYRVAKTSDPASGAKVAPGDVITYTVTVTPDGRNPVDDVVVVDDLAQISPYATLLGAPVASQGSAVRTGDTLTWSLGTIGGEEPLTLTYRVQVKPDAIGVRLHNAVTTTGEVPPTSCEPCDTTHTTAAAWDLTKSSDPASGSKVKAGDTITYTLTATSRSRTDAVKDIVITDDLSAVLPHAVLQQLPEPSVGTVTRAGSRLTWRIPSLAPGATATLDYEVTVDRDVSRVLLRNVVGGMAPDNPPSSCPQPSSNTRIAIRAAADARQKVTAGRCSTEHTTLPEPSGAVHVPPAPPVTSPPQSNPVLPWTGSSAALPWVLAGGLLMMLAGGVVLRRRGRPEEE